MKRVAQMFRGDPQAGKRFARQAAQGAQGALHLHDLEGLAQSIEHLLVIGLRVTDKKKFGFCRQYRMLQAPEASKIL
jgi:hypothetical protein